MRLPQPWLCYAAVFLPVLAVAPQAGAEEKKVHVTVIAIVATDQNKHVDDKVKEIAQEVQKVEPSLTGFRLVWTGCKSLTVGKKETFKLVDDEGAEVLVRQGVDKDGRITLTVKPPLAGEITYATACEKFFPILTRYHTKGKPRENEKHKEIPKGRLIVAVMVKPCPK